MTWQILAGCLSWDVTRLMGPVFSPFNGASTRCNWKGGTVLGGFDCVRPRSVDEACRFLSGTSDARVLAGGTDLLVEIRNRLRSPELLVDIKPIEELAQLQLDGPQLVVGASVPLNRLAEHRAIRQSLPALADSALSIGTYQLRNRATLIGNVCNASPAADSAPILLVCGAELSVASTDGWRKVPISELFTGVKRTCLAPGEIVTAIRIPVPEEATRTAFLKQQRIRGHDLAVVNVAGSYAPASKTLMVSVGSCAPTPVLLEPVDTDGNSLDSLASHVVELAEAATSPISDVRASAEYRRAVLPVLLRRLLDQLLEGGVGS
jgi:CO/xanthine dehydrogenase FAD-binding subunit